MSTSIETNTISYGKAPGQVYSFNLSDLPQTSVLALASKGLAHSLGNECASKVSGEKSRRAEAGEPEMSEAEVSEMLAAARERMVLTITEGTMGVSAARGPRANPIDSIIRRIGTDELRAKLAKAGLRLPQGKNKETGEPNVMELPSKVDGTTKTYTAAELVGNYIAAHSDRLTKLAERELKAVANAAKSDEPVTVDSLFAA